MARLGFHLRGSSNNRHQTPQNQTPALTGSRIPVFALASYKMAFSQRKYHSTSCPSSYTHSEAGIANLLLRIALGVTCEIPQKLHHRRDVRCNALGHTIWRGYSGSGQKKRGHTLGNRMCPRNFCINDQIAFAYAASSPPSPLASASFFCASS
jgi:hypothetical protein